MRQIPHTVGLRPHSSGQGISSDVKSKLAMWLFRATFWNNYILNKVPSNGQTREQLTQNGAVGRVWPGRAYQLDGVDQFIYIADNGALDIGSDSLYFSLWFKRNGVPGDTEYLGGKAIHGSVAGKYALNLDTNGYLNSVLQTNSQTISKAGSTNFCDNEWHFAELIVNQDDSTVKLFCDGIQQNTTYDFTGQTFPAPGNEFEFYIGEANNATGSARSTYAFNGSIRDVRLFKSILTTANRTTLYTTQEQIGTEDLWWWCEGTDLVQEFDASGNGHTGTKTNFDTGCFVEGSWQNLMNKYGYAVTGSSVVIPPDMSTAINGIPQKDIEGNDLVFKGQAKYHAISKEAACFKGDGTASFASTKKLSGNYAELTATFEKATGEVCSVGEQDDTSHRIKVVWQNDDNVYLTICNGSSTSYGYVALTDFSQPHTIEGVFDGSLSGDANRAKLYIDGVLQTLTFPGSAIPTSLPTFTAYFGIENITTAKIYNVKAKDTVESWWPFCEGIGAIAYDVSGNGNHATGTNVDETNWSVQDEFHYLRDHGCSTRGISLLDSGKGTFDSGTESWAAWGNNTIENDGGALKITYVDDNKGAYSQLSTVGDLATDLTDGKYYKIRILYKSQNTVFKFNVYDGVSNTTDLLSSSTYEWVEFIFKCGDASVIRLQLQSFDPTGIVWIDEWDIYEINKVIPALMDRSAAADGGELEYPQLPGKYLAIPGTYFKLPENIYELIQADSQLRYGDEIASGNLTIGERYLITAHDDADFTLDGAANNNIGTEFIATGTSVTLDAGDKVRQVQQQTGNNLITDGEGSKFIDDNSDGIGNGWEHSNGSGTPTIVTGNEFAGNAQRITHVSGADTKIDYPTGVTAISGVIYQITGKYRAGEADWRLYLRGTDIIDLVTSDMGASATYATAFSYTIEATAATEIKLMFYKASGVGDDWLEFDEIEVRPVIDWRFYEPEALGGAAVLIDPADLPDLRYLVQAYDDDNRKNLILAESGLTEPEWSKLVKFTNNQ